MRRSQEPRRDRTAALGRRRFDYHGGGAAAATITDMTKTELIIQLAKIVLGVAFGAYFLWWSVEVLHRLPPH